VFVSYLEYLDLKNIDVATHRSADLFETKVWQGNDINWGWADHLPINWYPNRTIPTLLDIFSKMNCIKLDPTQSCRSPLGLLNNFRILWISTEGRQGSSRFRAPSGNGLHFLDPDCRWSVSKSFWCRFLIIWAAEKSFDQEWRSYHTEKEKHWRKTFETPTLRSRLSFAWFYDHRLSIIEQFQIFHHSSEEKICFLNWRYSPKNSLDQGRFFWAYTKKTFLKWLQVQFFRRLFLFQDF
jgi:hypothetical protein